MQLTHIGERLDGEVGGIGGALGTAALVLYGREASQHANSNTSLAHWRVSNCHKHSRASPYHT